MVAFENRCHDPGLGSWPAINGLWLTLFSFTAGEHRLKGSAVKG